MVKRRWVREVDDRPMQAELLKRICERGPGPALERILDPTLVVFDLQMGSLKRLNEYLKMHKGIPHPEVAAELSTLLSGRFGSTKYRLIAIEHPDAPAPKSGPAQAEIAPPTPEQLTLIASFNNALITERGKKHLAEKAAAALHKTSVSKVQRARRAQRAYEAELKAKGERLVADLKAIRAART